jgi:Ca2+-transporting ATPase
LKKAVWHEMETSQVLKELDTDPQIGLSSEEVTRRLEKYGYNELKKGEKVSPLTIFINQFKNILIIILLLATVLSGVIGEIFDAVLILVIVIF